MHTLYLFILIAIIVGGVRADGIDLSEEGRAMKIILCILIVPIDYLLAERVYIFTIIVVYII